jgi:predicted permease
VLVLGAALTLQSLWHMSRVDLGVRTDDLLVLRFSLPGARGMDTEAWQASYRQAIANVQAIPGVEAAGLSSADPLTPGWRAGLRVSGRTFDSNNPVDAGWAAVSPGFTEALGTSIVSGRGFDAGDGPDDPGVAIVNQALADQVFPGQDPIGQQINTGLDGPGHYVTVVGVMADVKNRGPTLPPQPAYVRPLAQPAAFGGDRVTLAVRSSRAPTTLVPAVQSAVWRVEPDAPFYRIETGRELGRTYGADVRFVLALLGAFALVALVLGAVGIYGVAANSARRRTREIGIRMALGAVRRQASVLIVREGLSLALVGTGLGALAALGLMRLLSSVLFGVRASDPLTYGIVAGVLVGVALLATWVPARRAGRTDPMTAIRTD